MRLCLPVVLMLSACGGASNGNFVADSATASAGDSVRVRLFVTTLQGGVKVGAKVTFSAPAPAVLSTSSAETNAQGVAETTVTMNTAGTVVVTATVDGADYTTSIAFKGASIGPVTPTKLRFDNAPANVTGQNLLRDSGNAPLRVVLTDDAGNVATGSTATVSVALTNGACTATIDPSQVPYYTTATPSNGVAEFGYLRFTATGTGCTLTATSAGLTSAVSGSFDVQ